MKIVIFIYDGFTALDAIGPYEVLARIPGAQLCFAGLKKGPVSADTKVLQLVATHAIEDIDHADILVVPGGPMSGRIAQNEALKSWLQKLDATSQRTVSICTGSLILAQAGLLNGVKSTTHWSCMEQLKALGAQPVSERVVIDGKRYSAAGVSAGIDMALTLVRDLVDPFVAQALQLAIEYDPQPPFNSGSPKTAPAEVLSAVSKRMETVRKSEEAEHSGS